MLILGIEKAPKFLNLSAFKTILGHKLLVLSVGFEL